MSLAASSRVLGLYISGFWGFKDMPSRCGGAARKHAVATWRALLRVVRKVFCRPLHAKLVGPSDRVCHDTHSDGVAVKAIAKGFDTGAVKLTVKTLLSHLVTRKYSIVPPILDGRRMSVSSPRIRGRWCEKSRRRLFVSCKPFE
eukprot:5940105-Pyramimonas_sp.AAC.1